MKRLIAIALAGIACAAPIRVKVTVEPGATDPTQFPYDLLVRAVDDGVPPPKHYDAALGDCSCEECGPWEDLDRPAGQKAKEYRVRVLAERDVVWTGSAWEPVEGKQTGEW